MPLPTTFAGDSARGEGLFSSVVSLGGNYWSATLTGTYSSPQDSANSIKVDNSGNIYVAGRGTYNSGGSANQLSVSKYNSSGVIQWQKTFSGSGNVSTGLGLNIDSSGNVYVCGLENVFPFLQLITKWDNSGTFQWARNLTDTYKAPVDGAYGVAVDSSGNVYVCGYGLDSNGFIVQSISKWNTSGTLQWQRTLKDAQSSSNGTALGIYVDSSGNVYISGYGAINSTGTQTIISISKWNNSGTLQWQRTLTDPSSGPTAEGTSITLDSSGNIYVCGFGLDSSLYNVLSISKWDNSGTIQWQSSLRDTYSTPLTQGYGVSLDSSGNVYACGTGKNSLGQSVMSISKWDNSGSILLQITITSTPSNSNQANAITVDTSGNMYVAGYIKNNAGNQVMSISKLPTDGSRTGTYTGSTFGITYATSSWTASTTSWTAATSTWATATSTFTVSTSAGTTGTSTYATDKVTI